MGDGKMFQVVVAAVVFGVAAGAVLGAFKRRQMRDEFQQPWYQPPLALADHPYSAAPWPTPQAEPEHLELAGS